MQWAHAFLLVFLLSAHPVIADVTSERLGLVAAELDAIVSDLESTQAQTNELRARLTDLETQSADHQAMLTQQDKLLAAYRASVAALETHDQAAMSLAKSLQGQLQTERSVTGWLWPLVGVAAAIALVEGFFLGARR